MMPHRHPLFSVASAGMELCWLCAWALFACLLIYGQAFPIPLAMLAFVVSAALTVRFGAVTSIRWRLLGLQIAALVGFATIIWLTAHLRALTVVHGQWIAGLLVRPQNYADWFAILVVFVWILLFWVTGAAWSRRSLAHQTTCDRFDLGAAHFFAIYLLKLLIAKRFGVEVDVSATVYLMGSFFIFGLFAIGFAKNQHSHSAEFLRGYRGVGILLAFVVVVFLFGLGSLSFFLPYSKIVAQVGYSAIKVVTTPLWSWFIELLILIFKPSADTVARLREQVDPGPSAADHIESPTGENSAFMHGAGLLYGVLAVIIVAGAIWALYRWLIMRVPERAVNNRPSIITWVIGHIRQFVLWFVGRLHQFQRHQQATYFYALLVRWGKRSGVGHFTNETPREFAVRLKRRFPQIQREVDMIVEHFNQCIYGGEASTAVVLERLCDARRKLCSPRLWPARIKSWLKSG